MRHTALSILLVGLFISHAGYAAESKELGQLQSDLAKVEKSIDLTKRKIQEVKDVIYLPDLYFVLGDLYVERARVVYAVTREKNLNTPISEIDFFESKKSKKQAIETYQKYLDNFPKHAQVDKALFFMAHEYKDLGNHDEMVKTYNKLINDFPKSKFVDEALLILGDYFLENKKEPQVALETYNKLLKRPVSPLTPFAKYKTGWCYINLERFPDALLAFESVLLGPDPAETKDVKLPEIYKNTDLKRDALLALVWPYSEQKKINIERAHPLAYFERLANNRLNLSRALDRLWKRLLLKNRTDDAIPVAFRLLELTFDLERKMEYIERFYDNYKQSKKDWVFHDMPEILSNTLLRVRYSPHISSIEKSKVEKNYEIYLRDFTTKIQQSAKNKKSEKDYLAAIQGYEDYLTFFPQTKYTTSMRLNLAEALYALKKYSLAGKNYEIALSGDTNAKKELYDSTLQSYAAALKETDKISKLEVVEAREGFRTVGNRFIKNFPNDPAKPGVMFNIARTYYDERDFTQAIKGFSDFVKLYPQHKDALTAGNLVMDSYNQKEDYNGLIRAGKVLANNRKLPPSFRKDVLDIVKQAELKKIEKVTGGPGSRDYAQKLLGFASKYQGSSIGDQALYEAFLTMKAKKDPQAYDAGEQLLSKHGDSKYAQDVVAQMGQMALNTADYRRAAMYFETFSKKYPQDPNSQKLLLNAANMRELMGDYDEAAADYQSLGSQYFENQVQQYIQAQDWSKALSALNSSKSRSLKLDYWRGLSYLRQGQGDQARPYFENVSRMSASSSEEKRMAAHSQYVLADQNLKAYQRLQLGSGAKEDQIVKQKSATLASLTAQYQKIINYGEGRWTIASLYQLGQTHSEFANFISKASIPAGLNAAQQAQYKQLISGQVKQYSDKSKQFYKSCLQNAEKYEVFTQFVRGCKNPDTMVSEESDLRPARATDATPSNASSIRLKLFDNPRDHQQLFALAMGYIKNQDYPMGRVVLSRILEIRPKDSNAQAWLGNTLASLKDYDGAAAAYKAALKANPNESEARRGLTNLYREFGFSKARP